MEVIGSGKHSSLLQYGNNYCRKKFYSTGHRSLESFVNCGRNFFITSAQICRSYAITIVIHVERSFIGLSPEVDFIKLFWRKFTEAILPAGPFY
jgi:hypothetical protein